MARTTHTPIHTVTTIVGRPFVVRYLPAGARYGVGGGLTASKPMVEFYDATHADDTAGDTGHGLPEGFGPLGQFTGGRYLVETLLGEDGYGSGHGGLDIGGAPWVIDAVTMDYVRVWLRATAERLEAAGASR